MGICIVLRPRSELNSWEVGVVGLGCAAEITHIRAVGRLKVGRNGTVHVQPGEEPACVVILEVDMAKEPAVLAASDEAEVGVVAAVGSGRIRDDVPAPGGEVALGRNDVGPYDGRVCERQHGHEEPSRQECGYQPGQLSYSL